MSRLRRQVNANTTNVVETKNLTDIKAKTGNLYESIAIIAKRANQINISLKEELHNKLEEFASHTDSLEEIHDGHRNLGPAERPACLEPPLPGNQPTFHGDDHRVQQADFSDAVSERTQVAQILAIAESDLDLINIHGRGSQPAPLSSNLHRARNRKD